jgi:hypothetical protein
LHFVADTSLGEDACTVRPGAAHIILSILRATIISLLHRAAQDTIAASLRRFSRRPHELIAFLNLNETENA